MSLIGLGKLYIYALQCKADKLMCEFTKQEYSLKSIYS